MASCSSWSRSRMQWQWHSSSPSMSPPDSECISTVAWSSKPGTSNRSSDVPCHSERNHSRLIARPSMLALLACIGLVLTPLRLAHANEATEPNIILEADVTAAVDKVRADPNLVPTQRVRVLRWVRGEKQERPAWHEWLRDFFRWVAESSRVL